MTRPQLENGYMRIANEIIDEVMRRDFSKRQVNILHFIWRLSYGFNKKAATIPRLADFALCGVGKQNVKTELEHLETCRVIFWDRTTNNFTFNKDHNQWIITPLKGWKREDFDKVIHLNLQEKFSKQEQVSSQNKNNHDVNGSQNKNFNEGTENGSSQIKNLNPKRVLKLRTVRFLKQVPPNGLILRRSKGGWAPKDIIKDIKDKDIKDNKNDAPVANAFTFYQENFEPIIPPAIVMRITDWLDDFSDEMVVLAMEKCLGQEDYKRKWSYINRILVNWFKKDIKTPEQVEEEDEKFYAKMSNRNRGNHQQRPKEKLPDWHEEHKRQVAEFEKKKEQQRSQSQNVDEAQVQQELQELIKSVSE